MRPIIFRAWDKKYNLFNDELWVDFNGRIWTDDVKAYDTPHKEIEPLDDRYILMQFTGLLDKNGKEIYEGDIVRGHNHKGEPGEGGAVEWSNTGYHVNNLLVCMTHDPEVIGNIYENPELVK